MSFWRRAVDDGHGPAPEPTGPEPGGPERRTRGPLLPGLAVVLGLLAFVAVSNPGSTAYWARETLRRATGATSTSYAFLSTSTSSGDPTAWDRCRAIRYVVNPAGAPEGWADLVDAAVAEVHEASGFALVAGGTTSEIDYLGRRPDDPVLIGWGSAVTYPLLRGEVAGFGGASTLVVGGTVRFVTGQVLLDSADYAEMAAQDGRTAMRLILVHELLHVLGLDHVDDRHELMYPRYVGQDLGPGDRAGLDRLRAVPCG